MDKRNWHFTVKKSKSCISKTFSTPPFKATSFRLFFVSGQIYTDSKAGAKFQSAAQGLITLATYGVGMLIGFWAAGQISGMYTNADGTHTWENIWLLPAGFSVLVFILFSIFFKNEKVAYKQD